MASHSSASLRKTPHVTKTSTTTINKALKLRAQAVINDKSIDAASRVVIRYALEIDDPWLPELVRSVDAGQPITDTIEALARAADQ